MGAACGGGDSAEAISQTKLPREFYLRDGNALARGLLGKLLVRRIGAGIASGMIVETEAYIGPDDLVAHSCKGRTPRTESCSVWAGARMST
jgi:DNA-3-methyladenine glycosylase